MRMKTNPYSAPSAEIMFLRLEETILSGEIRPGNKPTENFDGPVEDDENWM